MGALSTTKVLKNSSGSLVEETTLTTSDGVADANKLVALNASGVLDSSIVDSTVSSAANKVVRLDGTGRLDLTVMPTGMSTDTAIITASESLASGDLVNVWNSGGVGAVRKADGSTTGKEAHGFVLASVIQGEPAMVYFEGTNTQCTGLTPGIQYLSATVAGKSTDTAPSVAGSVVQRVGFAISPTALNFQSSVPIVLS